MAGLTGSGNGSRTVPDRIQGKQSLHPDRGLWFLWTLAIINVLVYVAQLMEHKMGVMAYVLRNLILLGIPLKLFGIEYVRVHFTWYAIGFVMPRYWKNFGGKKWITWIGLIGGQNN